MNFQNSIYVFMCVFFCLLVLPFLAGVYPVVNFTEEEINITVYPGHVHVKGAYLYENPYPFPVTQGFSIPLPKDNDNPEPVMLSAAAADKSEPIPIRFVFGKHRFAYNFSAKEKATVIVKYSQYAPENNAYYILTTTQPWKKPLVRGVYTLTTRQVDLVDSNYVPETRAPGMYYFEKARFMPPADWQFSWREPADDI